MGLSSDLPRRLVIDIECAPLMDAATYLDPVSAPANYKDPVKIAEAIAEGTATALAKAALDPDLCRIVALGCADTRTGVVDAWTMPDEATEREVLEQFWRNHDWSQTTLIGYNLLGYDALVLLRRSLYLGLKAPQLQVDKYRHPMIVDLMQLMAFGGTLKYRSLAFYLRRFGIPADDPVTGADVPRLVQEGQWDAIRHHVQSDVLATLALARRLRVA